MPNRRFDRWLPTYALTAYARAQGRRRRASGLTHVMVLVCDHFEPRHGITNEDQPAERLAAWHEGYAALRGRCLEAFGKAPVHSWFYPPHHGLEHLRRLSTMVYDGLGEVELHYHHRDDTAASLRAALGRTIAEYQRWGFLLSVGAPPETGFGFIHGDWALDNSCHGRFCGVDNELSILQELGCWADFTMPSGNTCQTRKINSIYYAKGRPGRSKSHDWGIDSRVGVTDRAGLFLMQGPLGINWGAPDHPRIENASLTTRNWGRPDRIRKWIDCNVHVQGKPEWLFIKLHAHGAIERDFDALFGERAFEMHRVLNHEIDDGKRYRLHYVTAREAYNIAKAAEAGYGGDPDAWRDYLIAPPPHTLYSLSAAHDLQACTPARLTVAGVDATAGSVSLETRVGAVARLDGALRGVDVNADRGETMVEVAGPGEALRVTLRPGFDSTVVEGADFVAAEPGTETTLWKVRETGRCRIYAAPAQLAAGERREQEAATAPADVGGHSLVGGPVAGARG